ncbi:SpaA isopeptide-forming pilin-related protein [Nocardioides sp.]|uniref:DUF7927 domain-containing protein n=1 Tax=Nocardioides sp. TaxID=35761 RepID=UPI002CD69FD2|nr:SpaA isopeptide-forming pilin-related protein [Nocardioides sp.]HSX68078.1 SpaA isopeptide-forming pilin-related protein [Nocardioides sp.]
MKNLTRSTSARAQASLALRTFLAAGVALLAVPTLALAPAYAVEGDPDTTAATSTEAAAPEQPASESGSESGETPPAPEAPGTGGSGEPDTDTTPSETPSGTAEEPEDAPAGDSTAPGSGSTTKGKTGSTTSAKEVPTATAEPAPAPSCKVTSFTQNTREDASGDWIGGNLNAIKGNYAEGDYVPQKVELSGLAPGTYTLDFKFQRMKGNLYAYDFVNNLRIENSAGATTTWASTTDPTDFDGPATVAEPQTGTYDVYVTISFTITDVADTTATLRWDGHIAAELDYGPNSAAGTINGSPYHFGLISTDGPYGCNAGNMANQLAADAVDAASITIIKNASPNSAEDFDFTITAANNLSANPTLDDDSGVAGEDAEFGESITYLVPPGTVTVTETPTAGWDLTGLACVKAGSPVGTVSGTGVSLNLADNDLVTCTFTNSRTSTLTVDKVWVINGASPIAEGSEPAHLGLGATLLLDDAASVWGQSYDDYLQDTSVAIDEQVTFGNPLCTWADPAAPFGTVDELDDAPLAETVSLGGGANHFTVTNRVTCRSELTLNKKVLNGPTAASAWTLSATPTGSGTPFASGSSGVQHTVTASTPYVLGEDDADPRYDQYGDWTCSEFGTVSTVDGDQQVSVAAGRSVACTVTNATGALVLKKVVQNTNGGDATPGDFTLVADPDTDGADDLTTPGSAEGTTFYVNPGESFALSETGGPSGYQLSSLACSNGQTTEVSVGAGETVTCTFTNTSQPGSLTLAKVVDDNGTGQHTDEKSWTLTASHLTNAQAADISGDGYATGATTAGVYQLSEEGPDTHTAGDWTCELPDGTDVAVDQLTATVAIDLDQDVTCTIVNTAKKSTLTLVKEVDPLDTKDETDAEEFALTATPAASITGQDPVEGDGTATGTVKVGTYTLSESGPATYQPDARGWRCLDGDDAVVPVNDADEITVALATDVTCTIENEAIASKWTVTKSADRPNGATVLPGAEIDYTITLTKVGDGVDVHDIVVEDTLTGVEDAWVSGLPAEATLEDGVITWNAPVLGSEPLTLEYTVTVGEDAWNATIANHVTPGPVPCVNEGDVDCDDTVHYTPHYTLDKAVKHLASPGDGDDLVEPGERLKYTLTVHNDTEHALVDTVIVDQAADVFDDATMVSNASELEAEGLVFDDTEGAETLTWSIEELAPGATVTATYVVQVAPGTWGETLRNVALPDPETGGECIAEDECTTETTVPEVTTMLVEKRDMETDEVLAGATFELFLDADNERDENGACTYPASPSVGEGDVSLGSATTLEAGQVMFADLQPGCYLLEETKAPTGYDLAPVPVMGVEIDEDNFVGGGVMAAIVVSDFAQGQITQVTKEQFELIDGEWVESDGVVSYGDHVRYVMKFDATGPKDFHDVKVTDHVPGFNLLDVTSTLKGVVVPGSPECVGALSCTTSVGLLDQLVTWDFGDLEPAVGETLHGVAVMEVVFPELPEVRIPLPGLSVSDTLWNVAHLHWNEATLDLTEVIDGVIGGGGAGARVPSLATLDLPLLGRSLETNAVTVTATETTPRLPGGDGSDPGTTDGGGKTPGNGAEDGALPQTGAPAGLALIGFVAVGLLAVGLGLARRKQQD